MIASARSRIGWRAIPTPPATASGRAPDRPEIADDTSHVIGHDPRILNAEPRRAPWQPSSEATPGHGRRADYVARTNTPVDPRQEAAKPARLVSTAQDRRTRLGHEPAATVAQHGRERTRSAPAPTLTRAAASAMCS